MTKIPSITILGVRVHRVTMQDTLALIENMALGNSPHSIFPVNPEMIMAARENSMFRETLNNASLVIPDGTGILYASWILGTPLTKRVAGADATKRLTSMAQQKGLKIFLLGAATGVAELTAQRLQDEFPGVIIAGTYSGSPHPDEEAEIFRRIRASQPHILFVAYGAPKQELWVARNLQKLNVPVVMCVGGTFDFIAGIAVRAPRLVRMLGLEWLFRLIREPRRWRRMLALPRFAFAVVRYRLTTFGTA
jgi:N-acetylglucosaminyldiphosphoundecaprenol N-acetyl-beta-D-mannosaminyltransferase